MYPIQILADSYKFFQQKYIITDFYINSICNWMIEVEDINIKKSFIECSIIEITNKILEYYNLEEFDVTKKEVFYMKEINSDKPKMDGFTAIICLKNNIPVLFEDEHKMNIKKGELLLFCNDIRYSFVTEIRNCDILIIHLTGKGKVKDKEFDDWWLKLKRNCNIKSLYTHP